MKTTIWFITFMLPVMVLGQSLETPPFDFDRKLDANYVDSLITKTKSRIIDLKKYSSSIRLDTVQMELLHFIGYVYRSGNYKTDSAATIANQLFQLAKQKSNLKYQIKAKLLLEYYFRINSRNYVEAMRTNYEILNLIEKSPEEQAKNLWRVNNNMGILFYRMEKYKESVVYLQNAVNSFGQDTKAHPNQLSTIYQSLGESYRMDHQYDKTLAAYQEALHILNQNKSLSSISNFAYIYADIATAFRHLQDYPQSLENYKLSESYWKKLNNKKGLALVWANMSEVYFLMKNYNQAIEYAQKGVANANNLSTTYIESYETLYRSFEALKIYEQALSYHKLFISQIDSVRKSKKISEMMAIQANFEKERLEIKNQQEKELQEQKILFLQQQEEIMRDKNENEKQSLLKTIQNNELRQQLEIERLKVESQDKQTQQQNTIKQLKINELAQQLKVNDRNRKFLYGILFLTSLFGIALLWFNYKLNNRNKLLKQKNLEIEAALMRGQAIERKRVASELHDNVNSILASVKASLQTIHPKSIKETKTYQSVMNMVESATREVRQISHNMLPVELEKEGLENALQALIIRLNLAEKTLFYLNMNGMKLNFDSEIAFNLYTICSELCQNIQKHAEASQAQIDFEMLNNQFITFVSDNGKGFEKEKITEGMGLKNIYHRAKSIGADLRVQSHIGEGTTFYLILTI